MYYEEYKKILKQCLEDAKKIYVEAFKKDNIGIFEFEAVVMIAIKLADIKAMDVALDE